MQERKSFEQKKQELEGRIVKILEVIREKEGVIEGQMKTVSFIQISELSRVGHPDYFEIKKSEMRMLKELEQVKDELELRRPMQELLIKRSQLEAKARGQISYSAGVPDLWKDLSRWEKMPEIVQKKIDEQENEIKMKQVRGV